MNFTFGMVPLNIVVDLHPKLAYVGWGLRRASSRFLHAVLGQDDSYTAADLPHLLQCLAITLPFLNLLIFGKGKLFLHRIGLLY
jgi:hypothetical protein